MLGLGSIVGTGVFVSIGIAAGVAGANVLIAIFIAALVATCNGLSSAQLASAHPVSGGTYEYGYRWLSPGLGFTAGWLFLSAKSASAATAALGLAGYLNALGVFGSTVEANYLSKVGIGLGMLALMTFVVVVGIKRTSLINTMVVSLTLAALFVFVVLGFGTAIENAGSHLGDVFKPAKEGASKSLYALLNAAALMFVAYTGYGRIATMGEEVANPRTTIPQAMIATLGVTMVLYLSVGLVAVGAIGAERLASKTGEFGAPLMAVTEAIGKPWVGGVVAFGAITAMLGVMLNLLLGLSRVVLAMSRRADLPTKFSAINQRGVPLHATILVTLIVGGLICIGDVRLSWSFSAMTVLLYYSITNLCAIRVDEADRIFPVWISWMGLISCLSLALFIQWQMLAVGAAILIVAIVARNLIIRARG